MSYEPDTTGFLIVPGGDMKSVQDLLLEFLEFIDNKMTTNCTPTGKRHKISIRGSDKVDR